MQTLLSNLQVATNAGERRLKLMARDREEFIQLTPGLDERGHRRKCAGMLAPQFITFAQERVAFTHELVALTLEEGELGFALAFNHRRRSRC